jgi:acetyl-CoA synthetase
VVVEEGYEESDELREGVRSKVGEEHGKPFRPREVLFVDEFPKTQSGKSSDGPSRRPTPAKV